MRTCMDARTYVCAQTHTPEQGHVVVESQRPHTALARAKGVRERRVKVFRQHQPPSGARKVRELSPPTAPIPRTLHIQPPATNQCAPRQHCSSSPPRPHPPCTVTPASGMSRGQEDKDTHRMSLAAAAASMSDWRRFESPPNERSTTSIFCTLCGGAGDAGPRSALQARSASALCEAPQRRVRPRHGRRERVSTPTSTRRARVTASVRGGDENTSRGPSTRGDRITHVGGVRRRGSPGPRIVRTALTAPRRHGHPRGTQ